MKNNNRRFEGARPDFVGITTGVVSAYVGNNQVPAAALPALIAGTYATLAQLGQRSAPAVAAVDKPTPAQIKRSIGHEALISFEDGKPYKTLRRHLTLRGLTAEAYREKWGLPREYPMITVAYSEARSKIAQALGLGQRRRKFAAPEPVSADEKPKRAGRPH